MQPKSKILLTKQGRTVYKCTDLRGSKIETLVIKKKQIHEET